VAPEPYHHGDLPNALRSATATLLAEDGLAGFSLREVARRAGVSHAAPAHHFGDAAGLLTAVAIEGFEELTARTSAAIEGVDDPVEALARLGRAYVEVSRSHPGHCAVLFRHDAIRPDDPAYKAAGQGAFAVLVGVVERIARIHHPDLDVLLASATCWATMQGLLTVDAPLRGLAEVSGTAVPSIGDLADAMTRLIVAGLAPG
jgi:AcrR family transcriptional regulator